MFRDKDYVVKDDEVLIVDEFTGRKFTFFSDPDDLPIELYEIACN